MANNERPEFTEVKACGHCSNRAPMQIVAKHNEIVTHEHDGAPWSAGDCYELIKCPGCGKFELRTYYYHDGLDPENLPVFKSLYPTPNEVPLGLPVTIEREYRAALKVRSISPNAYGVLMGRVLDLVCEDKNAKGNNLNEKLADLAKQNEIPHKLIPVAEKLRFIRNVGAHATLGELTEREAPILESLSRAILGYVYSTPHLVEEARMALEKLHRRRKSPSKK